MSETMRSAPAGCAQVLSALAFVFAALAIASGYTYSTAGTEGFDFYVALGALVSIEFGGVLGLSLAAWAAMNKRLGVMLATGALGVICVGNALVNGGTFAWGKHVTRQAEVEHRATVARTARDSATAEVTRLQAQLAAAPTARAASAVLGDLRECETNGCRKQRVGKLRDELDAAETREGVVAALQQATAALDQTKAPPAEMSALGALLHEHAGANPAKVDLIVALLYVALLQLAAPLSGAAAALLHAPAREQKRRSTPDLGKMIPIGNTAEPPAAQQEPAQQPAAAAVSVPSVPRAQRQRRLLSARGERVVQLVQQAGGEVRATTRRLAAQLDMHQQSLGHAIREAVEAGVLLHTPSPRGTVLQLA